MRGRSASRLQSRRGGFADAEARELAAARRNEMMRPLRLRASSRNRLGSLKRQR